MTASSGTEVVDLGPDLRVTTRTTGSGPPLLVLHGGSGPASTSEVVEHCARTHRVLAPVHPGWDGTSRPARLDSVGALADVQLGVVDAAGARGAVVVGSSFGGWVALEMALRDTSGRVSALVLLDPVGSAPPALPAPRKAAQAASSTGPAPRAPDLLRPYTGPQLWDAHLLRRVSAVELPVLVLWGEEDPVLPPTEGRRLARALPHGALGAVPHAGHLPWQDEPAAVFTAVDDFLSGLPDR